MTSEQTAKIYLETAAIGFVAALRSDDLTGAREFLATTALAYAASAGSLDAAERAELQALRRFRDGVAALRSELARGFDPEAGALTIETIDALFAVSYPAVNL